MPSPEHWSDLVQHLTRASRLERSEAARLVEEVLSYFAESTADYVARRHRELQTRGQPNAEIYRQLGRELSERRFGQLWGDRLNHLLPR